MGSILLLCACLTCAGAELTVSGTRFLLDGKPFPWTGISFFNGIYNETFNHDAVARRQWLAKFRKYGINVIRVWGQRDTKPGFADTCPECTLYHSTGELRSGPLERLKQICGDADAMGIIVELAMFSQESWHDGIRLTPEAANRAATSLARELMPWRNVVLQVWNEFDERTLDHVKTIRSIDAKRLVTNSPGFAGVLIGIAGENESLSFLTPHTSRQRSGRTWEIAPKEIAYLLARYRKPVVDDEPARNGTPQFGGPKSSTSPWDHIIQIQTVWRVGGYVNYHHDMFQMGSGHPTVPPSGIPDPEFSPYHRQVFEFLSMRERYMPGTEENR